MQIPDLSKRSLIYLNIYHILFNLKPKTAENDLQIKFYFLRLSINHLNDVIATWPQTSLFCFCINSNIVSLQTQLPKRPNFKSSKTTVNNYNFYILIAKLKNKKYRYTFIKLKFFFSFYSKSDHNQKFTYKDNDVINSHLNNETFLISSKL